MVFDNNVNNNCFSFEYNSDYTTFSGTKQARIKISSLILSEYNSANTSSISINESSNNIVIESSAVEMNCNLEMSGNILMNNSRIVFEHSDDYVVSNDTGIISVINDLSSNLLTSYRDASFNNVEINGNISISGDIIPTIDNAFDIGSPEYNFKDLYLSANSLWIGDEIKIGLNSSGTLDFRKRVTNSVPNSVSSATSLTESTVVDYVLGSGSYSSGSRYQHMKLKHWKKYLRDHTNITINGKSGNAINIQDIFNTSNDSDWQSIHQNLAAGSGINVNSGLISIDPSSNVTFNNITSSGTITSSGNITGNGSNNYFKNITLKDTNSHFPKIYFYEDSVSGGIIGYNGTGSGNGNRISFYSETSGWVSEGNGFNYIPKNGRVGIGTTSPGGLLHIYESNGTSAGSSGQGTLVLEHGNTNGKSSLTFVSANNRNSDYGAIEYESGSSGNEKSILRLIAENDEDGEYEDQVKIRIGGSDRYTFESNEFNILDKYKLKNDQLKIENVNGHNPIYCYHGSGNNCLIVVDSNKSAGDTMFGGLAGHWNGTRVASLYFKSGSDTTNKDDGYITFETKVSGLTRTEVVRITSDGKLGIGTTSPSEMLDVNGNIRTDNAYVGKYLTTNQDYAVFCHSDNNNSSLDYGLLQHKDGDTFLNASSGKKLYFRTNNTNEAWYNGNTFRIRNKVEMIYRVPTSSDFIFEEGLVILGTNASYMSDPYRNDLFATTNTTTKCMFRAGTVRRSNGSEGQIACSSALTFWAGSVITTFAGGDIWFYPPSGSNVRTNRSFIGSSDDRLKFNEIPVSNALNIINQLNVVKYDKVGNLDETPDSSNTMIEIGLIAQEVELIPELNCAVTKPNNDKDVYGLNYDMIHSYHIKATQELDTIVQNQQSTINELNTKISNLEAENISLKEENTLIKSKLNEILSEMGKETI